DGGIFLNGKGHAIFADGLKVNGSVFLRNYFNATGEVRLRKVTINGDFNCIKGKFSNKNKEKKDVYALSADGLNIKGTVFMRDGFQAEGEVRLPDAKIGGGFDCTKGTFLNEGGRALSADRVNVKSGVFCSELQAKGEVRLPGAIIDGNLECGNGTFLNKEGRAVFADGIEVKGNVFFNGGFRAKGEVRLPGATINGSLDCIKGTFTKKRNGEREAYALNADGANIKGSVFLREGFQAEGEVRLPNAEIGGYLDCENGKFKNEGAYALSLDGLKVKGSVHLRDEFQAEGQVCLVGVTIEGLFSWTKVDSPEKTILNLRYAKIGTLDDPDSWPQGGNLLLDGLVYNNIADLAPKDAQKRIGWLHRQPFESFRPQPHEQSAPVLLKNFWPQPYEQLASVLRKSGHEEDAKQILIQKNEDRARLQMPFIKRWLYRILFGWTVGYGYRPVRTLGWIAGFIALGCFVFWIGFQADVITPTKKEAYIFEQSGKSSEVSQRYPGFSALAFSVDTFVPLINLHQADYWLPNTKRWLYWYMCFHIVMGWIFTTLFIMGLTGLIRS
ncbi:MAG: hypothetical protein SV487_08695, partial [Thermodesulfobacteriota bacterium]|nr:hypothetical protein [Thermodesulfobacteriota bacterium]